jgi:hypothetical protein
MVGQRLHLCDRPLQAVFDLNLFSAEPAQELHIVVAGDAEPGSRRDHVPHNAESVEDVRSAIRKIAEKDRPPACRVPPTLIAQGSS